MWPQDSGVLPSHAHLGATVSEVLPGQGCPRRPRPVRSGDVGREDDVSAAAADAMVELIVLVRRIGLVEWPYPFESGTAEAAQKDCVRVLRACRVVEARS